MDSRHGDQSLTIDAVRGWQEVVRNKSLHGPVLALRLWERWQAEGPRAMGDATYLGTMRILGRDTPVDFTQVTTGEVEAIFYTDPQNREIVLIEIEVDKQLDRLEVYFENYRPQGKISVPTRLRVGYGPETRLVNRYRIGVLSATEWGKAMTRRNARWGAILLGGMIVVDPLSPAGLESTIVFADSTLSGTRTQTAAVSTARDETAPVRWWNSPKMFRANSSKSMGRVVFKAWRVIKVDSLSAMPGTW